MAVRKKAIVEPAGWRSVPPAELTKSSGYSDEELEPDQDLQIKAIVSALVRRRVIEEWLKGILAFPVAIAGGFLMSWSSKSDSFAFWFGTISGLVIFCVGLAYAVAFIKLLIGGDLTKATVALMKGFEIKEWMRTFLALFSIGAGICFVLRAEEIAYYLPEWMPYFIGIVLIAGGITYFWTRSKFYRR